jgi:hypothetical protein
VLRDPTARGDGDELAADLLGGVPEGQQDGAQPLDGVFAAHAEHGHHELLAADPGDRVLAAERGLQVTGEPAQHLVTAGVPVPVVDPLEVVDVHHRERQVAVVAVGEQLQPVEVAFQPAPLASPVNGSVSASRRCSRARSSRFAIRACSSGPATGLLTKSSAPAA